MGFIYARRAYIRSHVRLMGLYGILCTTDGSLWDPIYAHWAYIWYYICLAGKNEIWHSPVVRIWDYTRYSEYSTKYSDIQDTRNIPDTPVFEVHSVIVLLPVFCVVIVSLGICRFFFHRQNAIFLRTSDLSLNFFADSLVNKISRGLRTHVNTAASASLCRCVLPSRILLPCNLPAFFHNRTEQSRKE